MIISVPKTKSLVIAKKSIRCKLAVNNKIIEQVIPIPRSRDILQPGQEKRDARPDQ